MPSPFLDDCFAVLSRTPAALDALLRGLPDSWISATEGDGTWSPYVVMGHLAHTERVDWVPRLMRILENGPAVPFDAVDRTAQLRTNDGISLVMLLDEFAALRRENLDRVRALDLQPAQFDLKGMHPSLGEVTLRQLLATWTAHDLAHLVQVGRVMAKRYRPDVGPWASFLSVMK